MKKDIASLFFCRTHDFLHVYLPKERNGTHGTFITYRQGPKTFRTYVNETAGIPSNRFEFKDCTYDFLLDYRNHLHDDKGLRERTFARYMLIAIEQRESEDYRSCGELFMLFYQELQDITIIKALGLILELFKEGMMKLLGITEAQIQAIEVGRIRFR